MVDFEVFPPAVFIHASEFCRKYLFQFLILNTAAVFDDVFEYLKFSFIILHTAPLSDRFSFDFLVVHDVFQKHIQVIETHRNHRKGQKHRFISRSVNRNSGHEHICDCQTGNCSHCHSNKCFCRIPAGSFTKNRPGCEYEGDN